MNNIVRVTAAAMAAILGGVQYAFCSSMDEPFQTPSEESARVAIRTQQILAHEFGIAQSVDPLGGSYLVETLTGQIERESDTKSKAVFNAAMNVGEGDGFRFDLLENPSNAFRLLLGQDVPIFTYDLPTLEFGFGYSQFFPYIIKRDLFGQRIYPENLGYVPLDPDRTRSEGYIRDIIEGARANLAVRDGFAACFFHAFVDLDLLKAKLKRAIAFDLAQEIAPTSRFVIVDDYEILNNV
jgi:hypothetical protein